MKKCLARFRLRPRRRKFLYGNRALLKRVFFSIDMNDYRLFDRYARPIACWPMRIRRGGPITMVSRSWAVAIPSNFPSSSSSTTRTAPNHSMWTPTPSSWLLPHICAPVRPKATHKPGIRPSSIWCVRSTGKVGIGNAYWTFSPSSTG